MKKVGEESLSSRDDFIAAMISELNKQKISQGNNSQFVTGGFLSASEVFRKLCFDYPLVDDQALQILVVGLKTVRQSNKSVEFRHSFFVHEKFLDNITYLIQDIEHQGKEMNHDDSDNEEEEKSKSLNFTNASIQADQKHNNSTNSTPEPSKRGKVLAIVAAEIYLHYPSYLMKLTKRELTSFLSTDGSHLFSTIPMGRVLDDLHWLDVITRFRNYILKSNVTLIATSTDANTLISNGSMTALLDCIASLQHLIDIVSPNKRADNLHNNTTTTKKSSITKANDNMNIVEYLEGQFTMYVNRKEAAEKDQKTVEALEGQESTPEGSTLPPSEEDLQAEQLLAMIKEIWTHLIYLYIDTLCRIPDLLSSQFMPLSDTLFQFPKKTATGPATMEDLFLFNNKQKAGPSLPLPNQYLGLMMISNISNYLTKEMELGRHPTLLRVVKEDIRKYYGGNSNEMLLTQVVEICEHIRDYNQQQVVGVIEKDTASKVKPPIDLESTNFLLDIAELLMYSDRYSHVTSTVANAIMTKFISSRLLASLMNVYVHILQVYQQLMQTSEADATQPANATAQLWLVSCRLTRVLSHAILLDVNIATFVFHYPQFIPSITNICKSNTLSSTSNQHVIWSPSFSAAMMFCLGLTLSASSISVQEIVQDNLQLMMKEVAGLEIEVLKDEREDAGPDHHEGDDSSTTTPALSAEAAALKRSQFSNQTRQLEGLIFITQLLVHDEIRSNLSRVDIDMNKSKLRNQLYSSLRSSLSSIYRSINRGRSGLNEVNGVNSMALSYYDKAIKNVKALLSLLEGGVSSKAD